MWTFFVEMKVFKPHHVLLFLLSVMLVLAPLVWFSPADGWDLGGFRLRFLTFNKFMSPVKKEHKDITKIVTNVDTTMVETPLNDTILQANNSKSKTGLPTGGKLSTESATQILFNQIGLERLHQLFTKMENAVNSNQKVRILHYGDSQIEGDRMTSYIRQRVQERFGGNGPGMIPALNVYNTFSFKQKYSPNFQRFTCFGGSKLKSRKYGTMNTVGRFTPEYMDSAERMSITSIKEAWIEIEPSPMAFGRAKQYNNVDMYYTSCYRPCSVKVYQRGTLIHEDSLIKDGKYHVLHLNFPSTPGKLRYEFSSAVSPNILGFSLEGDVGVQVDNIAMRGSSGTFFGNIDQQLAAKMYADMNTELIIMQFGGNSVPFFKDSSGVRHFAKQFKGQLNAIRKLRPSAAIIVIGPSDMSKLEDGVRVTYPYLPACVAALKKVSMEVGAGYYDLYSAMGGRNSMPSWVERGLAGDDYIHFSNRGASIASQLFYDAFSAEYAKWKTQ